jgi:hypothetical protein
MVMSKKAQLMIGSVSMLFNQTMADHSGIREEDMEVTISSLKSSMNMTSSKPFPTR